MNNHSINYNKTTYTTKHKFKQVNHRKATYFQNIETKLST